MALQPKKLDKQNIENMLGITTIQEGLLFHHLMQPDGTAYFEQLLIQIDGPVDRDLFAHSWMHVTKQHEMLRTLFRWQELARPVQIVLKQHQPDIRYRDLTQAEEPLHLLKEEITAQDREERFDLQEVPFRLTLCEVNEEVSWVLISFHHILLDGWSLGIVLSDWMSAYERLSNEDKPLLEKDRPINHLLNGSSKIFNRQKRKLSTGKMFSMAGVMQNCFQSQAVHMKIQVLFINMNIKWMLPLRRG